MGAKQNNTEEKMKTPNEPKTVATKEHLISMGNYGGYDVVE